MISQLIAQLISKAIEVDLIEDVDAIYVRNQVMALLYLTAFDEDESPRCYGMTIPDLLEQVVDYACNNGIIENQFYEKEILSGKIMNCFLSRPSDINKTFYEKYQQSPKVAMQYFYELSKNSNYIQTKKVQNNIKYKVDTEYGALDITINLSKPEKDPNDILLESKAQRTGYPKCLLCVENEGYVGKAHHPARSNHRMIRLNLSDEVWYFQYSPYVYYNEHCIVLCKNHVEMNVNEKTLSRLLSFVKQFPHYFLGSNADIPIVGGSILSHDHCQGGNYEFAMAKASSEYEFKLNGFSDIGCSTLKWPMAVIRLKSGNINSLVKAGAHILKKWKAYSDETLGIIAHTGDVPHNTVTPIARYRNGLYELDIVLRNNRTSDEYPLGIFHPHPDVWHIKKENIGLIEVMGLAVLPARLKKELKEVERYLLGQSNNVAGYHLPWAVELKEKYKNMVNESNVESLIRAEVGKKFLRALEDASVYKRDGDGSSGFKRFIHSL